MFQLWNIDDCYSIMARHTCVCYWDCTWDKRHGWDSSHVRVPLVGVSYFNPTNRSLVDMVSGTSFSSTELMNYHIVTSVLVPWSVVITIAVGLSLVMCCFHIHEWSHLVSIRADGRSGLVSFRAVDVRFVCHSANAGKNCSTQKHHHFINPSFLTMWLEFMILDSFGVATRTGWCSWIWSLRSWWRSKLASVHARLDDLLHGHSDLRYTGDILATGRSFPTTMIWARVFML